MAVGRSSSGSERTYCANSLAWAYPGVQDQRSVTVQSAHGALPLRRLRVEGPLGGQLDSSYDNSVRKSGMGGQAMEYQFVVTQLSRNPT